MSTPRRAADRSDAIIVGAGLAGLVAAAELVDAGRRVTIVDQEPEATFGGQAWWSFGGLFLVDSPEQRRMGIRDSLNLARQDWTGTAGFDRPEDDQARAWADAYLEWAAGEKRSWLRQKGIGLFPVVGWAERGGDTATRHGNSVPRFHIVWGTGPAILEPFIATVRRGVEAGLVTLLFRHRGQPRPRARGVARAARHSPDAHDQRRARPRRRARARHRGGRRSAAHQR